MSKTDLKEILFIVLFSVINILIACLTTYILGIQNYIIFTIYTAFTQNITYEVIIFILLSLYESVFYTLKYELQ